LTGGIEHSVRGAFKLSADVVSVDTSAA